MKSKKHKHGGDNEKEHVFKCRGNFRLNRSFKRLDNLKSRDESKDDWESDHGETVAKMVKWLDEGIDPESETPSERALLDEIMLAMALIMLKANKLRHLCPTLGLISKNGKNREESIRELAMMWKCRKKSATRLYERHRGSLSRRFISRNGYWGQMDISEN